MPLLEVNLERKYLNLFIRFLFKNRIYEEYLDFFKNNKIKIDEINSPHRLIGSIRTNDLIWFEHYHNWQNELSKLNKLEKISNDSTKINRRN